MSRVAGGIDGLEPVFDDGSLVADAGLLLPATVMGRLGLEALIDDTVRLWGRPGGAGPGRKVLPAHTHQPSGHPAPNRRSHKPVGGFRLRCRVYVWFMF